MKETWHLGCIQYVNNRAIRLCSINKVVVMIIAADFRINYEGLKNANRL